MPFSAPLFAGKPDRPHPGAARQVLPAPRGWWIGDQARVISCPRGTL
jgi:hypothetical protein